MMILQYPDTLLRSVSLPVTKDEVVELSEKLLEAYKHLPGNKAGLAAPQIGINKRIAIVGDLIVVNPFFKGARQWDTQEEGCYSLEEGTRFVNVTRHQYGWATWTDPITFTERTKKVNGIVARVFQHELDHLDGKLCHEEK